ncbi:MAG: transketolase [Spirochaetes bacterium]|nr:transketolase [Spirochaetota bacterium]
MDKVKKAELENHAREIRARIIKMITLAGSGHPGGSLSLVEILVYLFFEKIKRTRQNALDENRDRFVLSKGHGVPALYAIFAQIGLLKDKDLENFRKLGSKLQGHPDRIKLPYVEASTGSLGQGLSVAVGMAIAAKLKKKDYRIYCVLGDGEIQQGQVWEALMSAPKFNLDNLYVFLDYNKIQLDDWVDKIMPIEPLGSKIESFNWKVYQINGHNFDEIHDVFNKIDQGDQKPKFIIAHTIKGKGVSFMENEVKWHGIAPNREESKKALKELYT